MSSPIRKPDDNLLYNYYSHDALNYLIDLLNLYYQSYQNQIAKAPQADPLSLKKKSILRFEIIARFCHYVEILLAFYIGYDSVPNPKSDGSHILDKLSKYTVKDTDNVCTVVSKMNNLSLARAENDSLRRVF